MDTHKAILVCVLALCFLAPVQKLAHKDSEPESCCRCSNKNHEAVGTVKAIDLKLPSIEINHEASGLRLQMQFM
jgi:hypothetical protein